MLAHNNNFPDKHTAIMFMLYHMDKKALVWRMEFMAAHTVSGQGIHLRTMDNFLAALDSAFQPFDMEGDTLRQLHALKQLSRPVDEYVSEFRVFATRAGLTDISQLIHLFRQGLDPDIAIQAIRRGPNNNLQAWIEAAKQGEEIICMERIYLGRKQAKRPNRILAKEKHYTNPNWLRPHNDYKDPNAMNVDNIQAILENYKNTLQDQEDSDDKQETTNQRIQKLVHQTLDNILTKDQKKSFKKGKCFSCGKPGHFAARCPNKPNFKTLPRNKTYKAKKNLFTKTTNKKRDLAENIPEEEPSTDSDSDSNEEEDDFPQSD